MSEEHITEDAEKIKNATGPELEKAQDAEKNYIEAKRIVDNERTEQNEKAFQEAQLKKENANLQLIEKTLEALNDNEPISEQDLKSFKDTINDINEIGSIDISVADINIDNIKNVAKIIKENNLSNNILNSFKKLCNNIATSYSPDSLKELSSNDKIKLKDSQNIIESSAKNLNDGLENNDINKIKESLEKISNERKNSENILENSNELKQKTLADGGENSWNVKKIIASLSSLLLVFATFGGIALLALKIIADTLSGCYQYNGLNKKKLGCPESEENTEYCSCGEISKIYYQPTDKKDVCISGQNIMNYPFCCNSQITDPTIPLCTDPLSKSIGSDGFIYYSYEKHTIEDIIANGIENVIDYIKQPIDLIFTILKWFIIGISVLIGIFIAFKLFSVLLKKKENDSYKETIQKPN